MSKVHMVSSDGKSVLTACGRRQRDVEEMMPPTRFGAVMPSLACTTCARRFRAALAATKLTNPALERMAALRRLSNKSAPAGLERLLKELIAHQATAFEQSSALSLHKVDLFEAAKFLSIWRQRLIEFVNTHDGIE
jgi:hypothetical protein